MYIVFVEKSKKKFLFLNSLYLCAIMERRGVI